MTKEPHETESPSARRPTSMKSILRRTTGRTLAPSAPSEQAPPGEILPGEALRAAQEGQTRRLADVPWEELRQAVTQMCAGLSIHGSVDGLYDLYSAVAAEWGKAHQAEE